MTPAFSVPFPEMEALVATAERFRGFPAPVGAIPFVFASVEAATAFRTAVAQEHPGYTASAVRSDGPRFLVDVTRL